MAAAHTHGREEWRGASTTTAAWVIGHHNYWHHQQQPPPPQQQPPPAQQQVRGTEELIEHMASHTGSEVFDSFSSKTSHAHNYRILAHGLGDSFNAAVEQVDPITARDSFLFKS